MKQFSLFQNIIVFAALSLATGVTKAAKVEESVVHQFPVAALKSVEVSKVN